MMRSAINMHFEAPSPLSKMCFEYQGIIFNAPPSLQSGWSLKMMVTVMMHHMFTKDNLDAPKYNRHLNLLGPANSTYKTIFV